MTHDDAVEAYSVLDDAKDSISRVADELERCKMTAELLRGSGTTETLKDISNDFDMILEELNKFLDKEAKEEERAAIRAWERDR